MIKIFRNELKVFKALVQELPTDHKVYVEGSTVGHIAFHAAQSANTFLRTHVLRTMFERNKPAEFGEPHTLEEVNKSLEMAIAACDEIESKKVDLMEKLASPIEMIAAGYTLETNLDALTFNLLHLSEHCGELTQVKRELKA